MAQRIERIHGQFKLLVQHLLRNPSASAVIEAGKPPRDHNLWSDDDAARTAAETSLDNLWLAFPGRVMIGAMDEDSVSRHRVAVWRAPYSSYLAPPASHSLHPYVRANDPGQISGNHVGIPLMP